MPRISLWNSGKKSANFKFLDRTISQWFGMGGTAIYCHLYQGTHEQPGGALDPATAGSGGGMTGQAGNITSVQDVLYMENRDRKYSDTVFELRGIYNITDTDFDLRQFGLFLQNDTLFISFHYNDMIGQIGRKLMPGDVFELPHLRDENLLDPNAAAINKFYVVEDTNFSSEGYSATWFPHIWRCKVSPMTASQEFADILDKQAQDPFGRDQGKIGDLMSSLGNELGLNEAVIEQAKAVVDKRYFETRQFWMLPGSNNSENPWVFAGDNPPADGVVVASGTEFPDGQTVADGDYFLRTDYHPPHLWRREDRRWVMIKVDHRRDDWSVAHRLLKSFINNDATSINPDGTVQREKVNMSQAVKPKADF